MAALKTILEEKNIALKANNLESKSGPAYVGPDLFAILQTC